MRHAEGSDAGSNPDPGEHRSRPGAWWIRPIWWLHGMVGAVALIGILDALGLISGDWLRVVHAVGGRWMDLMRQLSAWLDSWLPFGWDLGPYEATFFLMVLVTILPMMIGRALSQDRQMELADRVLAYTGLAFVVYGMVVVLAPGKIADAPGIFSSAGVAVCIGFILSISSFGGQNTERRATYRITLGVTPLIVLILSRPLGWAVPDNAYTVAMIGAGLIAAASVGVILFRTARPFVTSFVATLGAIIGIQLLTIVPAFAQQIAPFL